MKNGKKLISLCLALLLCLSLAACASEEDKAFDAANALLESGDYDGAIAAFEAIGRYQEISAKIDEAAQLRDDANAGFLFGTWKDVLTGNTFVFEAAGKVTLTTAYAEVENTTISMSYTCSDGVVQVTYPTNLSLNVKEVDGVTHLMDANMEYDLVPEADYEDLAPITVEITMDNWQEYFELRQADDVQANAFGEPEYRNVGYAVFLKEEYVQRLLNTYGSLEAGFEIQYDEGLYKVNGDLLSGEYTLEEGKPRWYSEPMKQGLTGTANVWDTRNSEVPEFSDLHNSVVGFFYSCGWSLMDDHSTYVCMPVNAQVIRVQGTLTLKR